MEGLLVSAAAVVVSSALSYTLGRRRGRLDRADERDERALAEMRDRLVEFDRLMAAVSQLVRQRGDRPEHQQQQRERARLLIQAWDALEAAGDAGRNLSEKFARFRGPANGFRGADEVQNNRGGLRPIAEGTAIAASGRVDDLQPGVGLAREASRVRRELVDALRRPGRFRWRRKRRRS